MSKTKQTPVFYTLKIRYQHAPEDFQVETTQEMIAAIQKDIDDGKGLHPVELVDWGTFVSMKVKLG